MSEAKTEAVAARGVVALGDALFTVCQLSQNGEYGLWNHLKAASRAALGPASFYARSLPVIEHLRRAGHAAEAEALRRDTNAAILSAAGDSDEAAEEYRRTPDGVAKELFWRTRETHPNVTEREFRAVVNEVNALDVFLAIQGAVSGPKEQTPSPSPAG